MAENSLWNCMSGTCWKSEPRVPGKAVCEQVSHWRHSTTKPLEGGAGGCCWLLNPVSCFWFHLLDLLSSIPLISAVFIISFLILGLWLFYPLFPSFLRLDSWIIDLKIFFFSNVFSAMNLPSALLSSHPIRFDRLCFHFHSI